MRVRTLGLAALIGAIGLSASACGESTTSLKEGTRYTLHLGGGMEDAAGHMVDLETYGMGMSCP